MQDAVAIDPMVAHVLGRIEHDPLIHLVDQVEVAQVREKVRLHDAKLHGAASCRN
jgi:hypothetical protein